MLRTKEALAGRNPVQIAQCARRVETLRKQAIDRTSLKSPSYIEFLKNNIYSGEAQEYPGMAQCVEMQGHT